MSIFSTFVSAVAFFALVPVAVPAEAASLAASASKCVLVDNSALNAHEVRQLEAKGYTLRRLPKAEKQVYIRSLKDHEYGFEFIRQTNTVVLLKSFTIRGQSAVGSYETQAYFGITPLAGQIISAFPNCQTLKSQRNRIYKDAHLRFFAKRIMSSMVDPKKLPEPQMGENLLAIEALQKYPNFDEAVRVFRSSLDRYKKYLAQIETTKSLPDFERLEMVRQILHPMWGSYCGQKPGLLSFLGSDAPCGNCVSSALLWASVLVDAKLALPKGYDPLIQLFGPNKKRIGHVRLVLRKRGDSGKVYDIVAGTMDSNVKGPLYSLNLVNFAALNKISGGDGNIVPSSNFYISTDYYKRLAVDLAPGISGFFAQLFQQDFKMPFRRSSGTAYDFGIGFGVFSEGDAPARATIGYANSDWEKVYPPSSSENIGTSQYQEEPAKPGFWASLFSSRRTSELRGDEGSDVHSATTIADEFTLTLEYFNQGEINWLRAVKRNSPEEADLFKNIFARSLYGFKETNRVIEHVRPIRFKFASKLCATKAGGDSKVAKTKLPWDTTADSSCMHMELDQIGISGVPSLSSFFVRQYKFINNNGLEITVSDRELYSRIKLLPAHKRLDFLFTEYARKIENKMASHAFQKLLRSMKEISKDPLVASTPFEEEGEIAASDLYYLEEAAQRIHRVRSALHGQGFNYDLDPRFIEIPKMANSSLLLSRRVLQEYLQISRDMSQSLLARKWDVIRQSNRLSEDELTRAYYEYGFASRELSKRIGTIILNAQFLTQLSLMLRGQDRIESQQELDAAYQPMRRMMMAALYDPEFQMAPPRDQSELAVLAQLKQRIMQRDSAPQAVNGALPPSPGAGKGQSTTPMQVTLIDEKDLPATARKVSLKQALLDSLDRKKFQSNHLSS